jgi:hypothetical protein
MITKVKYDLVSGWKRKRYDSVVAKTPLNYSIGRHEKHLRGMNDFNCGLKAYKILS